MGWRGQGCYSAAHPHTLTHKHLYPSLAVPEMFLSAGVLPRGTGSGLLERMRLRLKGRGNRVLGALCMEEASGHKEGNNSLKERTKCFW